MSAAVRTSGEKRSRELRIVDCNTSSVVGDNGTSSTVKTKKKQRIESAVTVDHGHFPPTFFTNIRYKNGICFKSPQENASSPKLNESQAEMWLNKVAASAAGGHFVFPTCVTRLLGVIHRNVSIQDTSGRVRDPIKYLPKSSVESAAGKMNHVRLLSASKNAWTEDAVRVLPDDATDEQVQEKVAELKTKWAIVAKEKKRLGAKPWHEQHGYVLPKNLSDPLYVPVEALKRWCKNQEHLNEPEAEKTRSLYNGLRVIETDLKSVLDALADLETPSNDLYNAPLLQAYPRISKSKSGSTLTYHISIGVYAGRLLPEIMTQSSVHVVMSALSADSYKITQALQMPVTPTSPVFESCPTPRVVTDIDAETKDSRVIDLTMQGSTRDEDTISAFSTNGIMKLLEHRGNDIFEWPAIEKKLEGKFKLDFMLHQRHAVCWMRQMESLGGFGINSILWEEREFLDGGRYYYSPALGQLRLSAPPTCRGGLLCDEMGLGKTCSVLGLIVATLDDVRREAENGDFEDVDGHLHATLIIVPPTLVFQWKAEIHKACGNSLKVTEFIANRCVFDGPPLVETDIVITTYKALEGKASTKIDAYAWGRLVLDEMQEVRSSTTKIAKNIDGLACSRRWLLSGTPLFEGIDDLRGELNILSVEPFAAKNEDGFYKTFVVKHWEAQSEHALNILRVLGLLMLRRAKSMKIIESGEPLMGLPPMTVTFHPVPQNDSERALYCFLEFLIARELAKLDSSSKQTRQSRMKCIRFLREMCISPVLLNGGMGVSSQLTHINHLMVKENRRTVQGSSGEGPASQTGLIPTYSCTEAVRYLSQVQEEVQTSSDFVSGLVLGTGGGMSSRLRATSSAEELLRKAKADLKKGKATLKSAKSLRARARWHIALELVTTGQLESYPEVDRKIYSLWKWKQLFIDASSNSSSFELQHTKAFCRGWRPRDDFQQTIEENHPDYIWAKESSMSITGCPEEVGAEEVKTTFASIVGSSDADGMNHVVYRKDGSWHGFISFPNHDQYFTVAKEAAKKAGIVLKGTADLPCMKTLISDTEQAYRDAHASYSVHPTEGHKADLKNVKKKLELFKTGLRAVLGKEYNEGTVLLQKALGALRTSLPSTFESACNSFANAIESSSSTIAITQMSVKDAGTRINRYTRAQDVADPVKQMSAFEALQALSEKSFDETWCSICMDRLGCTKEHEGGKHGMVVLTSCGHLYCRKCLMDYRSRNPTNCSCPECRKPLVGARKFVFVDPNITRDIEEQKQKRQNAKQVIQRAADMLKGSTGQLDPEMWEQLYLSFDLPRGVNTQGDKRLTAIPKEVIQHFQAATGMEPHCPSSTLGSSSSKMQALLTDLPKDEPSVVFTGSTTSVRHLTYCLKNSGIGYQAIFTGQNADDLHDALERWKDDNLTHPVLVVQSGAAASGLTLTSACKMFVLEPFVRQEEEKQAYARIHRYGQTRPVSVKVYYTPVSVESRLLEWRRKTSPNRQGTYSENTEVKYSSSMEGIEGMDDEEDAMKELDTNEESNEDIEQTLFLLGINKQQKRS